MVKVPYLEDSKKYLQLLSVFEQKIFVLLISGECFNLSKVIGENHSRIPKALKNIKKTRIFKFIRYEVRKGKASLTGELKSPFIWLNESQPKYIGIKLDEYLNLRNKYAMLLYMLFCKFKKSGKIYLKEKDFREYLGVSKNDYYIHKYRLIGRIIKPAIKQIEAVTSVKIHFLKVENGGVIIRFKVKDNKKKQKTHETSLKKIAQIKEKVPAPQACSIFTNIKNRTMCEELTEKGVLNRVAVQALQKLNYNEVQAIYMAVEAKKTTIKYYPKYLEKALKNATELKFASESQQKNITYKQNASSENHTTTRYHQVAPNTFVKPPKKDNTQAIGNLLDQSFFQTLKNHARK